MFGLGVWELVIIFAIILLLFGGNRLPSVATGLGTAIRNFKTAMREPDELPTHQTLKAKSADHIENVTHSNTSVSS